MTYRIQAALVVATAFLFPALAEAVVRHYKFSVSTLAHFTAQCHGIGGGFDERGYKNKDNEFCAEY